MTEMFTTIHPVPRYCVPIQGWIQEIWIRGVEYVLVYVCAQIDTASRGVWGHAPPVKVLILGGLRLILVHFKVKNVIFAWLRQRALLLLLEVSVHKHGNNRKHGRN